MNVVDFYPQTFHDIPKQDNPAFGNDECLMIFRESADSQRYKVAHIVPDPDESVNLRGIFWRHEDALRFCDIYE